MNTNTDTDMDTDIDSLIYLYSTLGYGNGVSQRLSIGRVYVRTSELTGVLAKKTK